MRESPKSEIAAAGTLARDYQPVLHVDSGDPLVIPAIRNDTCRYCGRSTPNATFRSTAHAIPRFLGTSNVVVEDECDDCNHRFGTTLEQDFCNFLGPRRTISQLCGKGGVPTHKEPAGVRIDMGPNGLVIAGSSDSGQIDLNLETNSLTLNLSSPPYRPVLAYKGIARSIVSVLPHSVYEELRPLARWIAAPTSGSSRPAVVCMSIIMRFVPGPPTWHCPQVFVLERKSPVIIGPRYIGVVRFGNHQIQLALPGRGDCLLAGRELPLAPFPVIRPSAVSSGFGSVETRTVNLSSEAKTARIPMPVILKFSAANELES